MDRVREARNNPGSEYDYVASVDCLILILPPDIEEKVEQYREKEKIVENIEMYDDLFRYIKKVLQQY